LPSELVFARPRGGRGAIKAGVTVIGTVRAPPLDSVSHAATPPPAVPYALTRARCARSGVGRVPGRHGVAHERR